MKTGMLMALICLWSAAATVHAQEATDVQRPAEVAKPTAPAPSGTAVSTPDTDASSAVAAPKAASASSAAASPPSSARTDRLNLDTTVVTGNRELPKVLYIVPWKKADIGDLPGQPFNSLLDEVLTPVDRDVFRREVTYYGAIAERADAAAGGAPAP